jgi:DNA-binding NarL/FixJ family response regulator
MLKEIDYMECSGIFHTVEDAFPFLSANATDIIFLDLNLPGSNGMDLIVKLRAHGIVSKIVVVSMITDELVILKALEAGANGFISKNTDFEELLTAIKEVMAGRQFLHAHFQLEIDRLNDKHNADWHIRNTDARINALSERELEVLKHIVKGFTNKEIAEILILSPLTIKTHRTNILRKLGLKNSAALAHYATSLGIR